MLAWKGRDGSNYQVNHGLPANLSTWLNQKNAKGYLIRDVPNLRLTLGPNNESFFVTDGKQFLWQGLPSGLATAIEKLRKKGGGFTSDPRLVCLGVNSSYILITAGNGGSWSVSDDYPELDAFLDNLKTANGNKGGMFASVSYVSLDAFDRQNFVLTCPGGGYKAFLPDELHKPFTDVVTTIPSKTTQTHRSSNGIGSILKLANLVLNVENAVAGGSGGGFNNNNNNGGGGGVDFTQANMDFTQGLQNQTWSSVDSAANWNVQ